MTTIVEDENDMICSCDRCGLYGSFMDGEVRDRVGSYYSFPDSGLLWSTIFYKMRKPDFMHGDYCNKCYEELTPFIYQMKDILSLIKEVNKLKGAINERIKNNRTA